MKNYRIAMVIVFFICCSNMTAHEPVLNDDSEKPYTGATLDAINGSGSPEEYKVKDDDDQEVRLKKQIINAIYLEVEGKRGRVESGQEQVFGLLMSYRKLHEALESFYENDQDQLTKVAKDMIQNAKKMEAERRVRFEMGLGRPDEWAEALAYRLQCELRLLQLEKKAK